jgi:hypothetical protein
MARKLIVEIVGDASRLTRSFNQSTVAANKFGAEVSGSMGKAEKSFTRMQRVAAGGFIGAAALGAGVAGLRKVLEVAGESEQVLGQTQVALESTGKSWQQYGSTIQKAVQEQSRLGFDDEALLRSFSLFVRQADDVGEALRRNNIAMDLARARFIDLEQAAALVNKAALGQAGALRRVGIDARNGASGVELLNQLEREFGGAAEEASGTAIVAQERLAVSVENLEEAIGSGLLPVMQNFATVAADAADMVTELIGVLGTLGRVKIPTIVIPFTTKEIGGGTFGGAAAKGIGIGILGAISPAALFAVAIKKTIDKIKGEPPPDTEFNNLETTFDDQKSVAKARDKTAKAFGEKGFQVVDNNLGQRLQETFDNTLAALDLKFDQATFAENTSGALAALDEIEKAVRKRIATEGRTTELLRLLFQVDQDRAAVIADAKRAKQEKVDEALRKRKEDADRLKEKVRELAEAEREAREEAWKALETQQFRQLGVGAGGEAFTPGIKNLRKQFKQLSDNPELKDAPAKLQAQMKLVGKALMDPDLQPAVRKWIADLFGTIRGTFDQEQNQGLKLRGAQLSDKILEALGFKEDVDAKKIQRFTQARGAAAPRVTTAAGAPAAGAGGVVISGNITVVADNPDAFLRELQKKAGRQTATSRGRFPGRSMGLG